MAKYRVNKHANILHNGIIRYEGEIIDDLTKEQAEKLADFLDLVEEPKQASQTKNQNKTSTKTTTKSNKTETVKTEGSKDDGGNTNGK